MRPGLTPCLAAFLLFGMPGRSEAQAIGPRPSALFIAGRSVPTRPAADTVREERDIVTPVLFGGLAGFFGSMLVAGDADGGDRRIVSTAVLVGASIGLLYGMFGPVSPE